MKPAVSVVIPVFNQERYLGEAIDSVLAQTYAKVETVVVDDGSTDRTAEIAAGYGSRIVYLRQENAGAAAALNRGIQAATGDLIGWLSSDDVYLANKVARQVDLLCTGPDLVAAYTDFAVIDAAGQLTKIVRSPHYGDRTEFIRRLILGNFVNGSSILARRQALLEAGLFDPAMWYHADANMWLRLLKLGGFGHVPEVLLRYRVHAGAASRNLAEMRRYRYVYFDKIWESHDLATIAGIGPARGRFLSEALIANGLYDRAWSQMRAQRASPLLWARLALAWSTDRARTLIARTPA